MISNVSSSAIESFMHASPGFQALHFAMEADKSLAELPAISKVTARQITTMVQRLTYRRRHPYATRSNKTRVVKTPGEQRGYSAAICPSSCSSGFALLDKTDRCPFKQQSCPCCQVFCKEFHKLHQA